MNTCSSVAALLQDCERSLAALLSAKADIHEEEEQEEYRRHQGEAPGAAGRAAAPRPCPIFLLLADESQETTGFQGSEWDMGCGQAGESSPLCCGELLSVLILGFSKHEAVRNSLVGEEQCPKVC